MKPFQPKQFLVIFIGCLCLLGAIGFMLTHGAARAVAAPPYVMEIRVQVDAEGNVVARKVKSKDGKEKDFTKVEGERPPANAKSFTVFAWKENPTCTMINQGGVWYKVCH